MRRSPRFLLAVFILASLIVYLPVFDNGFRRDDFAYLEQMVEFGGSWQVLAPVYRFAFFRPGAVAMFQGEYAAFGMHNALYLITNYLMHVAVALSALRVLRRLGFGEWMSVLAVGLFVIGFGHYGKTVMWAASGGTVLATLLCVVAVDLASGPLATFRSRAALAAAVLLAPSFHEIGILAGILAVLRAGHGKAERWGLCGLLALAAVLTWGAIWTVASQVYEPYGAAAHAFPEAPLRLARYLSLFVLPIGEAPNASAGVLAVVHAISHVRVLTGIAMGLSLGLLAYRVPPTRFLVLWLFAALIPFTLVGLPGDSLQLRYTYPAALPWCAVLAFLLARLRTRVATTAVAALVIYSTAVHLMIAEYYDRSTNNPLNQALREELHQLHERVARERGEGVSNHRKPPP